MISDETIRWLIGGGVASFGTMGSALIGTYVAISTRVTRVETRLEDFIMLMGSKVAKAMHSPDNHHGMDEVLEKLEKSYVQRNYELTRDEWEFLKAKCEAIMAEPGTNNESALAAMLAAICDHKLTLPKKL